MTSTSVEMPGGEALVIDGDLRKAWAAAHVVMKEEYAEVGHSLEKPGSPEEIGRFLDWDATASLRRNLGAHGFGIAEAMDTAQRFFIGWENARKLIEGTAALKLPGGVVAGAGYDHHPGPADLNDLCEAVAFQARTIAEIGGIPIVLPMPWLCERECGPEDFVAAYRGILERLDSPVYLHWLGDMFLPVLEGYFPDDSFDVVVVASLVIVTVAAIVDIQFVRAVDGNGFL